jgi:antitoxin HicB
MTSLKYPFAVSPLSEDEGGGYLIEFPDLPGCMSDGATLEEALRNGVDAVECWIEAMRQAGRPIPARSNAVVSKRTIPTDDHTYQLLAEEARRQGLSVETMVNVAAIDFIARIDRTENAPAKVRSSVKTR